MFKLGFLRGIFKKLIQFPDATLLNKICTKIFTLKNYTEGKKMMRSCNNFFVGINSNGSSHKITQSTKFYTVEVYKFLLIISIKIMYIFFLYYFLVRS